MKFKYVVSQKNRKAKEGEIEAAGREEALNKLESRGWEVINLKPRYGWRHFFNIASFSFSRARIIDVVMMTKHLAVMLKAGLALDEAMEILIEQSDSAALKKILGRALKKIKGGEELSAGLALFPKVFSPFYINLVKVGEKGGTLEESLGRLAVQLNKDYELRRRVKGAMLYPIIVLVVAVVLGMGISLFILPRLSVLFSSLNFELPLATKVMVAIALFLQDYGLYAFFGLIILVILAAAAAKRKIFHPVFHRFYLEIPIIKRIVIGLNLARFSMILGTLLESGIPVAEAVGVTSQVLDNYYYRQGLAVALEDIKSGFKLSDSLSKNSDIFTPVVYRMINVGERSGKLEEVLGYLSEFYEAEVDTMTKNLATLIEPLLLILIGLIVGGLAVAVISPVYNFLGSIS